MKTLLLACLVAILAQSPATASELSSARLEQLQKARAELSELLVYLTEESPLVKRKREQIVRLEQDLESPKPQKEILNNSAELLKAKAALNELLASYTDQHPFVVAKREELHRLENGVRLQAQSEKLERPCWSYPAF